MRRVGVTLESVLEAAETIQSQGENPTIDRVRAFLGDTGSNTTIAKYMQIWRAQTSPVTPQAPITHTPPDPVQMAVKRVWQQIREETDAEIVTIKADAEKMINDARVRMLAADDDAKRSKERGEELEQQLHAIQAQSEIQKLDFQFLNNDHLILQERYQSLDKRYQDLELLMAKQIEEMTLTHQKQLTLHTEKLSEQETLYQKLISEIKLHAEDQRNQHMQALDELKTSYKKLQKDLEVSQSLSASKDILQTELKAENNSLRHERDGYISQLASAEQLKVLLSDNNALIHRLQSALNEIAKMESTHQLIAQMNRLHVDVSELKMQTDSIKAESSQTVKLLSASLVTS